MTTPVSRRGGRSVLRLLKALSRVHAFAEADPDSDGGQTVRVMGGSELMPDVIQHVSASLWERVCSAGLVEKNTSDQCWRISAAGRKLLTEQLQSGVRPGGGASGNGSLSSKRGGRIHTAGEGVPVISVSESPLAWLYRRRDKSGASLISESQFQAGERLRRDYETAQLMPRLTVNWERAASGETRGSAGAHSALDISDRAQAARERVSGALSAVGAELARVLVDVCCHLNGLEQLEKASGWPQRSGKIVLQVALSALARHYRIDRTDAAHGSSQAGPARVLHWGADGYRPETVGISSREDEGT